VSISSIWPLATMTNEYRLASARNAISAALDPVQDRNERPADADQEAVRAGHVGCRELDIVRPGIRASPQRVVEVDRVLGQDGEQGQAGKRDALRDMRLGSLGAPREQEAGAKDRDAEQGEGDDRCGMQPGETNDQGRYGRGSCRRDTQSELTERRSSRRRRAGGHARHSAAPGRGRAGHPEPKTTLSTKTYRVT